MKVIIEVLRDEYDMPKQDLILDNSDCQQESDVVLSIGSEKVFVNIKELVTALKVFNKDS